MVAGWPARERSGLRGSPAASMGREDPARAERGVEGRALTAPGRAREPGPSVQARPGTPGFRPEMPGTPRDGNPRRQRPRFCAPLSCRLGSRGRAAVGRVSARVAVTVLTPRARGKRTLPTAQGLLPAPPSGLPDHYAQRNRTGGYRLVSATWMLRLAGKTKVGRTFPLRPASFGVTPPMESFTLTAKAGLGSALSGYSGSHSERFCATLTRLVEAADLRCPFLGNDVEDGRRARELGPSLAQGGTLGVQVGSECGAPGDRVSDTRRIFLFDS